MSISKPLVCFLLGAALAGCKLTQEEAATSGSRLAEPPALAPSLPLDPSASSALPRYAVPALAGVTRPGLPAVTGRIHVDQFGYRPGDRKVAVISDPEIGFNAAESYAPPAVLEIRSAEDGSRVMEGPVRVWNAGQVDEVSGDRGWWFEFSELQTPGNYYVFDAQAGLRSPVFRIAETVYRDVLRAAVRTFYYQRLATPIQPPHAELPWVFEAEKLQDRHARHVLAKDDPATERDLSGGWMDAGDSNKYPTFNSEVIHPLLFAFSSNPGAFTDDFGLPESGNGLPDLLDEVKWQLDFLVRMQEPDGGVLLKLGYVKHKDVWPMALDDNPRYYIGKCTGASIAFAGYMAHAARVYAQFPAWESFALDLQRRALLAWDYYAANPKTTDLDTGEVKSGNANRSLEEQTRYESTAAYHLWRLTGEERFHARFREVAPETRQLKEWVWSPYEASSHEHLAEYAALPEAEPRLAKLILGKLRDSAGNNRWAPPMEADLYRAWMEPSAFHWGSNSVRAAYGSIALTAATTLPDLAPEEAQRLRERALGMVHSFHGVNPLSLVYLTNMRSLGAELSATRFWHDRFGRKSPHATNPPPGYVVGGANRHYSGKGREDAPDSVAWIAKQPPAKAYADFNETWPLNSWEITENGTYYQAKYIRLLSEFVRQP